MKQLFSIVLAVWVALFSSVPTEETFFQTQNSTYSAETPKEEKQPVLLNHNTLQTVTVFSISEDGMAYVYLDYTGYRNITTSAVIEIRIENQEGKTVYTETILANGEYYQNTIKCPLTESGVYRCTVLYTVSGIGAQDDIIPFEDTKIYQSQEQESEKIENPSLPSPVFPIPYETITSLSANAAKKYMEYGGNYLLNHGEEGYIGADYFSGERYILGDFYGLYQYQPSTHASKLFCEVENCTHLNCAAVTVTGEIFNVGGNLYRIENGKISILCYDQWQTVWQAYANEKHIFFLDANERGSILRVDRDGNNIQTIYENTDMNICAHQMLVLEDSILVYAQKIGNIGGKMKHYAGGWYRGALDTEGNIVSLTYLEAKQ